MLSYIPFFVKVTVQAIQKQTGFSLSLRDVPLDTFQLYIGRQHHLAVELDGKQYDLLLNDDSFNNDQPTGATSGQKQLPAAMSMDMPGAPQVSYVQRYYTNITLCKHGMQAQQAWC
jgi:hypothetical protein